MNIFLRLYLIEPFPIHASDDALRDEGLVVYLLHEAEDGDGFGFLCQEDDHFDRFAGIAAHAVEDGAAAVQVGDDPFGYLIIFVGEDQELDGLAVSVQYGIYDIVADEHFDESEYDLFHVMKEEEGRTDDDEVAEQQGASDGYVLVFVYDSRHDIRSARAAACRKDESQSGSAEERTDYDRHERLVVQQRLPFQQPFEEREGSGKGEHTEYGF